MKYVYHVYGYHRCGDGDVHIDGVFDLKHKLLDTEDYNNLKKLLIESSGLIIPLEELVIKSLSLISVE